MKNTRRKSMKGGGCGCSSGGLLGFPQAGGQMFKSLGRRRNALPMNSSGGPDVSMPMYNSGMQMRKQEASRMQMPMQQSNVSNTLASIQAKLDSINAKLSSMPKSEAQSQGFFGGGQNGGFLGLFENKPQTNLSQAPIMVNAGTNSVSPMNTTPNAQNVVKMPAVSATNSGSAEQRIRNLEERLSKMEQGQSQGGFAFFGGARKHRKTRKTNKKRSSSRK